MNNTNKIKNKLIIFLYILLVHNEKEIKITAYI